MFVRIQGFLSFAGFNRDKETERGKCGRFLVAEEDGESCSSSSTREGWFGGTGRTGASCILGGGFLDGRVAFLAWWREVPVQRHIRLALVLGCVK